MSQIHISEMKISKSINSSLQNVSNEIMSKIEKDKTILMFESKIQELNPWKHMKVIDIIPSYLHILNVELDSKSVNHEYDNYMGFIDKLPKFTKINLTVKVESTVNFACKHIISRLL